MSSEVDRSAKRLHRRWATPLVAVLLVGAAIAWTVRSTMWPCGALDRSSGCVQRVQLDLAAAGLNPATARVDYMTFDLGPDATIALIGASPGRLPTGHVASWACLMPGRAI
jgi:hypothetical protein